MSVTKALFEFDQAFKVAHLAGVDEAGRGPLAGPVVCACCVMPRDAWIEGVNDSKQVSAKAREALYDEIVKSATAYAVAAADHRVIDEINILNATKQAMYACVKELPITPDLVLIDAVKLDCGVPILSIVKGDEKSYAVAAASILAKVTRDRLMAAFDREYPGYGFVRHKGYGTREHIAAIKSLGVCDIHRRSFLGRIV
ncbi:MAG: ribonuclease HII [Clostridiales bacterium]|jgi:ribonuclease HII|nr:ribonuclease HII [Clostridiales bacterium]